ncbi:SRPBCC domain-containing protein [Candidatus Saccharibacteria bacterium]|nr:SRPBCC domain-containing protein [Candidatus Saccharibacteria bacterium]
MKEMQFKIKINATREKVWGTLWRDKTLREWAGLVDPGTYMAGELNEGNTVQFISGEGYGVTSLVAKLVPNEYILFKHQADTQDKGLYSREDQWTGGKESYSLTHKDGITTLVMTFDVPTELEQVMSSSYPKALQRVKELSENN